MEYIDPMLIVSLGGLALGLLMVVGGYFLRPRGELRTRQGAEIAASFMAVVGVMTLLASTLSLVRAI
jgi:hypothetical protein